MIWSAVRRAIAIALLFGLAGCPVGPDFVKPEADTPSRYRSELQPSEATSFADTPWFDVFQDATLRGLIEDALASNHDLETATSRVEQALHEVGIARSEIFPQAGYQGSAARGRNLFGAPIDVPTFNLFLGAFNLAWEVDVWGRIRRATEASEAALYATADVRRGVVLTLVSRVATSYFTLEELDLELDIARRATESFTSTLDLFTHRYDSGADSKLSVERARSARASAAATIPRLEKEIVQEENRLCTLLGRTPGPVAREKLLTLRALPPATPPGLPSELLRRRPDILEAERRIEETNAEVGVAVASFFPRIGLTSLYGGQSTELENIVKTPGVIWSIAGSIMGPIFQGGRLTEAYRARKAAWEAARTQYAQAVLTALAEVSDALVAQQKLEGVRSEQAVEVDGLRSSVDLALLRYDGGRATYFEVLEAQQQLFPAELALARTDLERLLAIVDLYRALGGGWQANDQAVDPAAWPTGP